MFFNWNRIIDVGSLNMFFEEFEEKEMVRKIWFDYWYKKELWDRKRIEGEKLICMIEEIIDY